MQKKMSVKEWIAVESNPIQRDTERHLARAHHLLTPHPTHAFVFAAQLPDEKLVKLDGHTRALAWERGMVEEPPFLMVGIIKVKNRAEAEHLYKDFDSRDALETVRDKVSGAFRRHSFEPNSDLLQSGAVTTALYMSYAVLHDVSPNSVGKRLKGDARAGGVGDKVARTDIYDIINEFTYELHALDGFMLRRGAIPGGVMAAFIASYRKHSHKVTPFWQGVFAGEGNKMGREMDYIQAVCEVIDRRRGQNGRAVSMDMMARCLSGVEHWLEEETTTRMPAPLDMSGYLANVKRPTERLIKKRDVERKLEAAE